MSADHNEIVASLVVQLGQQLDRAKFRVRANAGHVRSSESYYIPDVFVFPTELMQPLRGRPILEVYADPLPLVVEVWSPSTGDYDVEAKFPEYKRRQDAEIWRIHPYDHTLTAWRRQPDGTYTETVYTAGSIQPIALPGVRIDFDQLFS